MAAEQKARAAVHGLGRGFDVTLDLKLEYSKRSQSRLIDIDESQTRELLLAESTVIDNVPNEIKFGMGDFARYRSDVLDFHQMSERFNQGLQIAGKMPLGLFNTMFDFKGPWQSDAASTRSLALDGCFISLYELRVSKSPLNLSEEVKQAVPSSWEPAALARFIDKYGTHIITGIKIGGKDVIYVKQLQSSTLSSADIQMLLEDTAEQRFAEVAGRGKRGLKGIKKGGRKKVADPFASMKTIKNYSNFQYMSKDNVEVIFKRKGGEDSLKDHSQWLSSVPNSPEVISMSFVPITSLLSGVVGSGFLTHAINLYLRYKPPIDELQYLLEFQIPRRWSHIDMVSPLQSLNSLQFSFMGPKLYVNTNQVIVGKLPVTGLRLSIEGRKLNRLAINLQYLTTLPKIMEPRWSTDTSFWRSPEEDPRYIVHVQWKSFSHVNTAPIEYVEPVIGEEQGAYVVTGAQLRVSGSRTRNVLYLQLHFSRLAGCSIRRSAWDHSAITGHRSSSSNFFSQLGLSSGLLPAEQQSKPGRFVQNSAVFSDAPPPVAALQHSKALKVVNITDMTKGSQDQPGHWIVTGANLNVENGKICLAVKHSLLRYS